jgi:hypothetical protein
MEVSLRSRRFYRLKRSPRLPGDCRAAQDRRLAATLPVLEQPCQAAASTFLGKIYANRGAWLALAQGHREPKPPEASIRSSSFLRNESARGGASTARRFEKSYFFMSTTPKIFHDFFTPSEAISHGIVIDWCPHFTIIIACVSIFPAAGTSVVFIRRQVLRPAAAAELSV